jgi:exopolysaccharide biosynthesis WecB/TagA/CpsF family protein
METFLYGGRSNTLPRLEQRLRAKIPSIRIVGACSPPFRELSPEEDTAIVNMINGSSARIVWVGLGCPKHEAWMHAHHHLVNAVMVGVGAAFDFHAGIVKRALEAERVGVGAPARAASVLVDSVFRRERLVSHRRRVTKTLERIEYLCDP